MLNTIKNNIGFLTAGLLSLFLAWITGTGTILEYIDFADPLNELGFFACMSTLGGMLMYCGFSR